MFNICSSESLNVYVDCCEDQLESRCQIAFSATTKKQILKVNYFLYMDVPHLSRVALHEKKSNIQWSMCGFKGFSRSDSPTPPPPLRKFKLTCTLFLTDHMTYYYSIFLSAEDTIVIFNSFPLENIREKT